MILNIALIIVGAVLVLWGADRLTAGAASVAERMHISQFVIGLTIVAFGTSAPEFCVSLVSALKGSGDLAVGNIVGSNIFNTFLIVGVSAMAAPMTVMRSTVNRDLPFAFLASLVLIVMCYFGGGISRIDALVLFLMFLAFMYITVRSSKRGDEADAESSESAEAGGEKLSAWKAALWIVIGLAALIFGSDVFVDGAKLIAKSLGVSDAVIGLTIVACGTSLPELASSVVAARKGNSGMAIGNVLGSNVFNICFILGVTGMVHPLSISGITYLDMTMLALSAGLLWLFSFTRYKVERWEGGVLALIFVAYITWLVATAA